MKDGDRPTFERVRDELVSAIRDGSTIDTAAQHAGVSVATVRSWLSRGRRDPQSRYASFAQAVDAIRAERHRLRRELDGPLTVEEAEAILAKLARRGSVPALKLWLDRHGGDGAGAETNPFSEFMG